MKKMTIIYPGGKIVEKTTERDFPLERLQRAVEGYIQIISGFTKYNGEKCIAYSNEDGKVIKMNINETATNLWRAQLGSVMMMDVLVGPIAIITEVKEEPTSN